jgi:hypothetical protein
VRDNQAHSCNDKTIADHTKGKSAFVVDMYEYFIEQLRTMGDFQLNATKSHIALSGKVRFGHIHRLGKDFVDIVFYFDKPYSDNLCFHKIANVPGSTQHNHYFRMCSEEDVNEEVKMYMKKALDAGNKK